MIFREKRNDRPQMLATQGVGLGVRMQRNPRLSPMDGYGIPPGVAARIAANYGDYGIPPGVSARVANFRGYGIPPGVAARIAAEFGGVACGKGGCRRVGDYGIPPGVAARIAAGFGEIDQNGDYIPGSDPTNFNVQQVNYVTQDPNVPYVDAGSGGVVIPPPAAGGSGTAGGVDWTRIITEGEKLAIGVVNVIVQGTKPAVGATCPSGYTFNAKAGVCMTQAAYTAWLQTQKGGGAMSTTTMVLIGGAALVGVALLMQKRRGGAMAGFGRWHKRKSHRKVRRARR